MKLSKLLLVIVFLTVVVIVGTASNSNPHPLTRAELKAEVAEVKISQALLDEQPRVYPSRANNWCMDTNAGYFASSTYPQFGFSINAAFDGERNSVHWGDPSQGGGGWADSTGDTWPDYIGCNIARPKAFERAVVTTYEDNFPQEPYIGLVRGFYGIEDYAIEIHKLDGSWVEVAELEENENTIRVLNFPSVVGTGCRLRIDDGYLGLSRVVEFECGGAVPEQDGAATNP